MARVFGQVTIIGVGMIGGSLGRALLARGLAKRVIGVDSSPAALSAAAALGAVSRGTLSLAEGLRGAELVILATPVMATLKLLPELGRLAGDTLLVSDVSSTKEQVVRVATGALPAFASFIGGHPMAGSDKAGVEALDENLFENALYILTTDEQTRPEALEAMRGLVQGLGAVPAVMDARRHDLLVGAVSHLPHLAATALVAAVAGKQDYKNELLALAVGGFRDTTRVALGDPEMWKDICLTNAENIVRLLDDYIGVLVRLRELTGRGDGEALLAGFRAASEFRRQVPHRSKGILPVILNLFVYIPDKPGVIGEVAAGLGAAGINIAEIELLRIREEEGGPLRLGFLSEEARLAAARELEARGWRVEVQEG